LTISVGKKYSIKRKDIQVSSTQIRVVLFIVRDKHLSVFVQHDSDEGTNLSLCVERKIAEKGKETRIGKQETN
jgi:hypothetical protein